MKDYKKKAMGCYISLIIGIVVFVLSVIFMGDDPIDMTVVETISVVLMIPAFLSVIINSIRALRYEAKDTAQGIEELKKKNRALNRIWFDKFKAELYEADESDYVKRAKVVSERLESKFDDVDAVELGVFIATVRFVVFNQVTGDDYVS